MLHAKDLIAQWDWHNADGPLTVQVYGRYQDGLIVHGLTLNNTYPSGKPLESHLPPPKALLPLAVARLRKGLLNGDTIHITTPKGPPSIHTWFGLLKRFSPGQCIRGYRVEWRPRGRPESSGRFANAEDFRMAVIKDLRTLRAQGLRQTQKELARLWYQSDPDLEPKAELDSLVAEIKRYCLKWYPWKILLEAHKE